MVLQQKAPYQVKAASADKCLLLQGSFGAGKEAEGSRGIVLGMDSTAVLGVCNLPLPTPAPESAFEAQHFSGGCGVRLPTGVSLSFAIPDLVARLLSDPCYRFGNRQLLQSTPLAPLGGSTGEF